MGDFSNSKEDQSCDIIEFKLSKVVNMHTFYIFNEDYRRTNNTRTLHKSYLYQKMFDLIDDMSPNSYFTKNQKQK